MTIRRVVLLTVFGAASLPAQDRTCTGSPGAPLGITGYTCASCGVERNADGIATYFFGAEPVVNAVTPISPFKEGDVITSVNGRPITTREGGQSFANLKPGRHQVGFRRWSSSMHLASLVTVVINDECRFVSTQEWRQTRIMGGAAAPLGTPTLTQADPTSRVGFAVSCTPACTRVTDRFGRVFWKHDGYPAVVAVRAASPAAYAGIQIGDLIAEVNGVSVTSEAGSRGLQVGSETPLTSADCEKCVVPLLTLGVIRDGQRRDVRLFLGERRP